MIWKEGVITNSRYHPGMCLKGVGKAMKTVRIVALQFYVWTQDLPNKKLE
jgi:hypothetical protein